MPSENTSLQTISIQQTEKSHHYLYLKEFRTQQCPLFLQHKCTQHRPYTCFHWHFMNQRRRRPVRKRDGTFNYSPDNYCTKFDETTGLCPDKDECPFLHRTAGDTERRYHLRYYKTGTCVHETDTKGNCVKNGAHCAFAHGPEDLRTPVYDIRELQTMDINVDKYQLSLSVDNLEKDKILLEETVWNDSNYVLAYYKTEPCKKPQRLCRQGYACPQYHNTRDRRRSPKEFKYRSPPCPNVKHGDDWGDPSNCEKEDSCGYCHSRTEQQFHPEIYKSTKCNDMVQNGQCPRGVFCAFAHVEEEMSLHRDVSTAPDNLLSAFIPGSVSNSPIPTQSINGSHVPSCVTGVVNSDQELHNLNNNKVNGVTIADVVRNGIGNKTSDLKENINPVLNVQVPPPIGKERTNSFSKNYANVVSSPTVNNSNANTQQLIEPIGKERSQSLSSNPDICNSVLFYHSNPLIVQEELQNSLQQQLNAVDGDLTLDVEEKMKRKQNLILLHRMGTNSIGTKMVPSTMSPLAPSFYPSSNTVESVIGNALDDINLEDFDISSIDRELDRDETNSVSSSVSINLSSSGCFGGSSVPVSIPHTNLARTSLGSLSQSPSSPHGILAPPVRSQQQKQEHQIEQAAAAFHSHPNPGKYPAPAFSDISLGSMSPRSGGGPQSPIYSPLTTPIINHNNTYSNELQRLHEELNVCKLKLTSWEDGYLQAKNACEAWQKEAEEFKRQALLAEEERLKAIRQRDEALSQLKAVKVDDPSLSMYLGCLQPLKDLEMLPITKIRQLYSRLQRDLERLEQVIQRSNKCTKCNERPKSVMLLPCNHLVCDPCAFQSNECPACLHPIIRKTNFIS